jgi:hypothetical protein
MLIRPPRRYPGHVHLNIFERFCLGVGSSFTALRNPYRHGDISSALASCDHPVNC